MNLLKKVNVGKLISLIINTIVVIALFLMFKAASRTNISLLLYIKCLGFIIFVGILKILTNNKKEAILIDILVCILTIGFILYLFKDLVTLAIEPVLAGKYSVFEFHKFFDPVFSQKTTDYIDIIVISPFVLVLSFFFRNIFIKNNSIIIYLVSMLSIVFYIYFEQHIDYKFFVIIFFLLIFKFFIFGFDKNLRFNRKQLIFVLTTFILSIGLAFGARYIVEMFSKPSFVFTLADFEVFKYVEYVQDDDANSIKNVKDRTFIYLFDPTLGQISNVSFFPTNEKVFEYEANYDIDRFVAYKFYDYDETEHVFKLQEDDSIDPDVDAVDVSRAINSNRFYFNRPINQLEEASEDLNKTVKVTNTGENNFVYYPYGNFHISYDGELITSYLDRGIVTSYSSAFEDTEYTININDEAILNESYLPYFSKGEDGDTPHYNVSPYEYAITYAYYRYLQVPESFKDVLTQFLVDNGIDPYDIDALKLITQIRELLNNNYKYSNDLSWFPSDEDPILTFLFDTKKGYSNHFAAAETMLYRVCGIPARYVYGYHTNGTHGDIRAKDGYAWCEVFYGTNWFPSDDIKEIIYEDEDFILNVEYEEGDMDQWGSPLYDIYLTSSVGRLKDIALNDTIANYHDYGIDNLSDYYYDLTTSDETKDLMIIYKNGVSLFPNAVLSKFNGSYHNDSYIYHKNYSSSSYQTRLGFDLDKKVAVDEKYSEYVYDNYLHVDTTTQLQLEGWFKEYGINRFSANKEALIESILDVYAEYYTYTLNRYTNYPGRDKNVQFLMNIKAGLCVDYAKASVELFRMCGIPTRYVSGYSGNFPVNKRFTLFDGSAHAWVEVYSKENGWETVEVTVAKADKPYEFPDYDGEIEKSKYDTNILQDSASNSNTPLDAPSDVSDKPHPAAEESTPYEEELEGDINDTDSSSSPNVKEPISGIEEDSNVDESTQSFNNENKQDKVNIIKYLLYFLLVITIIGLLYIIYRLLKKLINKNKPTLPQMINIYYQLLSINKFVENDIHFMMERLKYSLDTENKEDLTVIKNSYIKLNSNLKKQKKFLVLLRNGLAYGLHWTIYLFINIFKIRKYQVL